MNVTLDVHLDGVAAPVARLTGEEGTMSFRYLTDASQISLSLPVREEAFGDAEARAFFANLIFENEQREQVMARHGIDNNDIAGLLFHLGKDCPGAISCVPMGDPPGKHPGDLARDYYPLDDLEAVMAGLERRRLPAGATDPSPLAGVQGKIAVAVHEGRLLLPKGGAPTTHILKVPRPAERSLVQDELSLLWIAAKAQDHPVARAEVLEVGDYRGLLIERYDRRIEDGLVTRIHQEDFCQALGFAPSLKYERDAAIPERRFDASAIARVLDQTDAPALARRAFFFGTLLNIALGNTDNHAKNHSLIYDRGTRPRLAPFYDIVPVMMDGAVNQDFSFRIGSAERLSDLRPEDLVAFAEAIGFRRFNAGLARGLREVLQSAADQINGLQGPGFKLLGDALGSQMQELSDRLDFDLAIPTRDLFLARGGENSW
ncbi:MAG: hypothetical protein B7X55_00580 [Rhodobacterales bacterium 34-62-10]|nr:MAG: hypothetical protein B7X55_00580 [Rhodobacterales bacterium 34-62-10]